MATRTIGFAVEERDEARLARLVKRYGAGNRSAFLRAALDRMESEDRSERLRALQAYGAKRAADVGLSLADIETVVSRVLGKRRRR